MTTNIPLWEAFELGRHLLSPCAGGGKVTDGKGCALQMAIAATGAKESWSGADRLWPWLREGSGQFRRNWESGELEPKPWFSLVWSKFDNEVMTDKSMSMDEFGKWLREIEERVAPKVASPSPVVEIPVTTEVWE